MNTTDHLIDEMLSAFFKAELPKQWPTLDFQSIEIRAEMPMPASLLETQSSLIHGVPASNKSRMALAVSAALILGGFWYLSDRFDHHTRKPGVGIGNGSASPKMLQKYSEPKSAKGESEVPTMP